METEIRGEISTRGEAPQGPSRIADFAYRASSSRWAVAGLLLATAIAAADLALDDIVLVGLLSAGPLLAGLRATPRGTAVAAVYALALGFVTGLPDGTWATSDHFGRLLVVAVAGAVSVGMASLRERAREAGVASRNIVHSVFHSALDCIISIDGEGRVVDLNEAAERTFGYTREEACGELLSELIIPERFRASHRQGLDRIRRGEPSRILDQRLELSAQRSNGEEFPVELTVTRASVDPPLFTGFVRDITERRAAEDERDRHQRHTSFLSDAGVLLESSLDYGATLRHVARLAVPRLADWAFVELVQDDGSIKRVAMIHSDPAKEALVREYDRRYPIDPDAPEGSAKVIRTGRPELRREIPDEMLEAVAQDPEHLRILRDLGFRSAMVVPLRARGRTLGDLALVSAESGRLYDEEDLATTQELATRCALAIDNARLYEAARRNETQLRDLALHDSLTGLPNRRLFLDRLTVALARSERRPGEPALLFFDLDGFKAVNDNLGHHVGDDLLKAVPSRVDGVLRAYDTISRFGGDEFAVLCEDITDESIAIAIAERVVAVLEPPFELAGRTLKIGASLGVVFARGNDETPERLLRDADAAMYASKRAGGGRFTVFSHPSGPLGVVGGHEEGIKRAV